jgi:hypothetical protein
VVSRRDALRRFGADDVLPCIVPWVVARVLVAGALELSRYVFDQVGSGRRPDALILGLFARDAAFYRDIAEHGYDSVGHAGLRFFPLVPLLARAFGPLFAGHVDVALLFVANVSALVFLALLHRLLVAETGDRDLARLAVWWGAVLPPALCLVLGYAEATMMALAVAMFLALRERRWEWAAVFGVLAGLSRPVGVFLAVPALVAALRAWRGSGGPGRLRSALPVVAPGAGVGIYLAWVGIAYGDAWLPFRVQEQSSLRGDVVDPFSNLWDAAHDLTGSRFGSGLHLVWAALFAVLLVVVARKLPLEWSAYAAAAFVVGLTADNLDSFERYCFSTFPLVVGAAFLTRPAGERSDVRTAALCLAGGAMTAYAVLVFLGVYVP